MALTLAEAGKSNSATSTATLVVTSTVSFAAGDMVVVCIAADNAGTQGASSISSVTDSKSHTYTQRAIQNQDPAAASAGATVAIYTAFVTSAMTTSDTFTVNFSPNTQYKSAVVWKATAASTEFPKFLSNGGTVGSTANPSLASTSIGSGDAVIYALAVENNATLTGDSDTTNGSWSTLYTDIGTGGTAVTSMRVGSQFKVVNATGVQTYNTTITASDWALAYVVLDPAAKIQRTATSSGTGTSSATGGILKAPIQRTATGSGLGGGSSTRVRKVLRTATGAGSGSSTTISLKTIIRSAASSGLGSSSASKKRIVLRTASSSGVSSSNNSIVVGFLRTAYGSGGASTGDQAIGLHIIQRGATSSASGSSTANKLVIISRIVSVSGLGSSSVSYKIIKTQSNFSFSESLKSGYDFYEYNPIVANKGYWGVLAKIG